MTLAPAENLYLALLKQLQPTLADPLLPRLVGIHSGGAWIARRLQRDLGLPGEPGFLDISFYRDDFERIGLHTQVQPSTVPFEVEGQHIILVDDVLYTGRTIRAAMNELFDYGRPARISLAVLVDRGGRQLPIQADYLGASVTLTSQQNLVLTQSPEGQLILTMETHNAASAAQ